jgi:GTPase SAR1 family protein
MWEHKSTQAAFDRKSEFQLNDSADYYFNQVVVLANPSYLPSEQDVLRSRVRTTGIVQTDFKIKGLDFAMFDVGGQRNERRKWIHAFDDVNSVIFVAALSEFDQVLYEDETQNRMEEAISLFDQIVNSRWFADTSMILFLNKKDLFEMKIQKASIKKHFADYDGEDTDFKAASEYFKAKFLAKSKNKSKSIYPHVTCATDTTNVAFVFNAVIAIILEQNMKSSGLS